MTELHPPPLTARSRFGTHATHHTSAGGRPNSEHCSASVENVSSIPGIATLTFCFRCRIAKTPRQRVNHQMPAERHSPAESDETARESVSAAKKIGRGAEKVPEIRAKSDSA